jgi:hypothetical protein
MEAGKSKVKGHESGKEFLAALFHGRRQGGQESSTQERVVGGCIHPFIRNSVLQ